VKRLLVICFFIQLLGTHSVGAKMLAPIQSDTERPVTVLTSFPPEHPADVTSLNGFAFTAFKSRHHRALPAMANWFNEIIPVQFSLDRHLVIYTSPLFLPLIRYLLYPNHYFW
jgi:hypothetical protein